MNKILNADDLAFTLGENMKSLRLQKNLVRESLAAQAGVSVSALRHLESGHGANLMTFIRVARALGKEEWLLNLAPRITVNPLHMVPSHGLRQRARRKKKDDGAQR